MAQSLGENQSGKGKLSAIMVPKSADVVVKKTTARKEEEPAGEMAAAEEADG